MDSWELIEMLRGHPFSREQFGGVVPYDQLPKDISNNETKYFVVNLDSSKEEGSHWVVCFLHKGKKKKNLYFDSYGYPPFNTVIQDFLGVDFMYNTKQVQHPLSTACGQWCLFFIFHQISGFEKESAVAHFGSDLLQNDHEINEWVHQTFGKRKKVLDKSFLLRQVAKSFVNNRKKFEFYL